LCEEFPCEKYDDVDAADSFITHRNQLRDLEKAKQIGMEVYAAQLNEKVRALEELLAHYDDGRKKSFFCLAVNLLELDDIKAVMEKAAQEIEPEADKKAKAVVIAGLFEAMAEKRDVSLKLRK